MWFKITLALLLVVLVPTVVFADYPASSKYQLHGYGFGSGGGGDSASTKYRINAISGENGSNELSGNAFKLGAGLNFAQQADVPSAPTLQNADNNYNKLHFVVNPHQNASDAIFALAVSTDDFVSDTRYVQNDNTIGLALGAEDYQTYAAWGGASGADLVGLDASTTYYLKAKAMHGDFTETCWGPTANAATVAPSISFDIDVSSSDEETDPPFTVGFGSLVPNSVNNSTSKVWIDLTTNAAGGGRVYVAGSNVGLASAHSSYVIPALTGDLSTSAEGYGAQTVSLAQGSGGPISAVSPYNGADANVGRIDTTIREIFSTANPINAGRASFRLMAKSTQVTPAATDYTDTLTLIASASF
jgi:hypothetical protein